jgi:integrase
MGRPAKHRIVKDHPSPRFRGKVKLSTQVHGLGDTMWYAQFWIENKWQPPFNPVSLHTRDWDEAVELARDRYALVANGGRPAPIRKPSVPTDTFSVFAQQAVVKLKEQAIAADLVAKGKGRNFGVIAWRIEQALLPRWAGVRMGDITEDDLNDWVRDSYRVKVRVKGRPDGEKVAAQKTLGNLDWAFRHVWDEAVIAKVVDRRGRPSISLEHGLDGASRPFIDHAGVLALKNLMTDRWVNGQPHRQLLRDYIAIAASTGIRAGLELERITIGSVVFLPKGAMAIRVAAHQGKHEDARSVVVYEAGVFPVRALLAALLARRQAEGASLRDRLLAYKDGSQPNFAKGLKAALKAAGVLIDPDTGRERVGYSFRHYFATLLIEKGLSVIQIAAWLGTGTNMIELHYNRYLIERHAHLVNGMPEREAALLVELARAANDPDDHLTPEDRGL